MPGLYPLDDLLKRIAIHGAHRLDGIALLLESKAPIFEKFLMSDNFRFTTHTTYKTGILKELYER